jgi:hypothetical protein
METIPYSEARLKIRVGDTIACRGISLMSQGIILFHGGAFDFSHLSKVIRDTTNQGTGHVEVLEAVSSGLDKNYLSATYKKVHGELFWIPMGYKEKQKTCIMETADKLLEVGIDYDWWTTITAPFQGIGFIMDLHKFNCSEIDWYLDVDCGLMQPRYDKKNRPIAPVPGDYPVWVGKEKEVYKLEMGK